MKVDRRRWLGAIGALPLAACMSSRESGFPATGWIGADPTIGHRLRTAPPDSQEAAERLATDVLIVGGGIGGLSAGWWLERAGLGDFLVAEIQPTAGGNARGGGNEISRFPLGAHYLPLPTRESFTLRRLLADLGALKGDPDGLRPRYEERLLCAAPQERLLRHGHWQEGVIPDAGLSKSEREEFSHFFALVGGYRNRSGTRKAFALPMACSRLDDEMRHLDTKTFGDWLRENGLTCAPLRWYVDYACRDDFGTPADAVSAWAGLHYFASRDGMAEGAANDVVLTAPEGNAWITEGLAQRLGPRVRCGWMVRRLTRTRSGFEASIDDVGSGRSIVCAAKAVIWAAPLFIAARVIEQLPDLARAHATQIDYAPWVMAQLTLESAPPERPGAERAWDNVVYGARSLGYVVATHQRLSAAQAPTVWTWYHALTGAPSPILRQQLLASTPEYWARFAIEELAPAYPELLPHVQRIDCIRHGHAMARPRPGFLTAPARHWFAQGVAGLQFAHADVSGFSVCEEAHARGVAAAERIAARLRGRMPDPSVIYSV